MDTMQMKEKGEMVCGNCGKGCGCFHHKMIPLLIALFGLDFLLGAMGVLTDSFVSISWPVLVIIAGITKMSQGKCTCC